jgi:hypothetical protein
MKTAMQELIDYMKTYFHLTDESLEMFDKALEKEKEQIIAAHEQGCDDFLQERHYNATYGKGYYNQTYNQTNVGNDGFEFDNSSTIPPPKTNNL